MRKNERLMYKKRILELFKDGLKNFEIAARLNISLSMIVNLRREIKDVWRK